MNLLITIPKNWQQTNYETWHNQVKLQVQIAKMLRIDE